MNEPRGAAAWMVRMSDGKMEAKLRQVFEEHVPFNKVIGLKVESTDPGRAEAALRHAPRTDRQSAPADPARRRDLGGARRRGRLRDPSGGAAQEPRGAREDGHFPSIGTIDLHVDYLRPGRGKYFIATGRVVRLGNRVAVAHMELVNDTGELIATGGAAYMVG